MILFGWNSVVWWWDIECLKSSFRQPFFGLREICLLGFGWAIFAFDNISGCFHCVNSAITVFTLANNLKHWYFVSWLNTDGYLTGYLLKFCPSCRQTPVMLQCSWCADLYIKKFHHVKSDFSWHSCTWASTTGRRLGRSHSFRYDDLFSSFFSGMPVYHFLQEDKLWKNMVIRSFAFLLYILWCFFLALLFIFAPMTTMPKDCKTNWMTQGRIRKRTNSYQFETLCAHFLTFGFSLKKTVWEMGDFSRLAEPIGYWPDFPPDSLNVFLLCL